jgi:hypothetical protein
MQSSVWGGLVNLRRIALVAAAAALVPMGWWTAAKASPSPPPTGTTCTWGGTATAPTGHFTISPGLTNDPSATASKFWVTGQLSGGPDCTGTLTFIGQIDAGGTCLQNVFDGKARGIPGVRTFAGVGVGPFGPAQLYDGSGNVVASENANINTIENAPHITDCSTPAGFTGGNFSSTIVFVK